MLLGQELVCLVLLVRLVIDLGRIVHNMLRLRSISLWMVSILLPCRSIGSSGFRICCCRIRLRSIGLIGFILSCRILCMSILSSNTISSFCMLIGNGRFEELMRLFHSLFWIVLSWLYAINRLLSEEAMFLMSHLIMETRKSIKLWNDFLLSTISGDCPLILWRVRTMEKVLIHLLYS